jgi:hypothetical protein
MTVVFSEEAARALNVSCEFEIYFDMSKRERRKAINVLRKVVKEHCKLVDDSATGFALIKALVIGPPTKTSQQYVVPVYLGLVCTICGAVVGSWDGRGWIGALIWGAVGLAFVVFAVIVAILVHGEEE